MAQWLGALATLPEDQSLLLSTQLGSRQPVSHALEALMPFLGSTGICSRAGDIAELVECLLNKPKALG